MHIKTFIGPNPQAVLSLIKLEMGSEAVILSSRDTVRDGQRIHEVVAGVDRDPASTGRMPDSPPPRPVAPGSGGAYAAASSSGAGAYGSGPAPGYNSGPPPGWGEWHKEWARVKEHLYSLMRPSMQWTRLSPRQRVALEFLQREGVEDGLIFDMFKRLAATPTGSILEVLGELVPVRPWNADNWKEVIHIISGPFGAGKTTTLIRMALLLKRDLPGIKVAVVNADSARGTGRLVLRHWAELSDFMYLEAQNADTMRRALRTASAADVVFVDTPGVNRQGRLSTLLAGLGLVGLGAAAHLVLPPYFAPLQMSAMIDRYQSGLTGSVVWSKLDETTSFAPLVNAAPQLAMPVSALSFGPVLRGSLVASSHAHLWKMLFKQQLPVPAAPGEESE